MGHWSIAHTEYSSAVIFLAWRSDVTLRGSWNMLDPSWPLCRHIFPDVQLWPWLLASARDSKCDVRREQPHNNVHHPVRLWSTRVYHVILVFYSKGPCGNHDGNHDGWQHMKKSHVRKLFDATHDCVLSCWCLYSGLLDAHWLRAILGPAQNNTIHHLIQPRGILYKLCVFSQPY